MTDKQQEKFIQFYQRLYGDTSKEGYFYFVAYKNLQFFLHQYNHKKYYHNKWTKLCYWEYVFEWLWLGYWPTVLNYSDTINNDWN